MMERHPSASSKRSSDWKPNGRHVWRRERPFFQVGDRVRTVVSRQVKTVRRLARLRETGHWEYEMGVLLYALLLDSTARL